MSCLVDDKSVKKDESRRLSNFTVGCSYSVKLRMAESAASISSAEAVPRAPFDVTGELRGKAPRAEEGEGGSECG